MNQDTQLSAFNPAICDIFPKKEMCLAHIGKIRQFMEGMN